MKRFYNNTLMSGAFSKALRVVALLCVLLGVSSSAWGATVSIAGDFNSWNTETNKFSNGTCTINISAGTYKFKIVEDGKWYGNNGTITDNVSNWTFNHEQACNNNCGDCTLEASRTGTYTFTWNESTNKLSVTFPTASVCTPSSTITGATYNTSTGKITLTGNLTETCGTTTYYGWQWKYEGEANWNVTHIGGKYPNEGHVSTSPVSGYSAEWPAEENKTYVFRAYAYQGSTFYSDNKLLTVNTSNSGNTGSCNSIEIYCHYDGSDTHDMNLHMWNNVGSDYTTWPGPEPQDWEEVGGKWYAKWVYEADNDDICLKFTNGETADDKKYESGNKCGLKSGNKYYFSLPNGWGGQVPNLDKTEAINCGGSGGDDDPVDDCNSEEIQIWCKGVGGYIDMSCYAWEDGNDSYHPLGDWTGSLKQAEGMYEGERYAVWTVSGVDRLNIIFNNSTDGKNQTCQTKDILGLEKGYRYIYTLSDNWCSTTLTGKRSQCGSGGDVEEVHNGSLYLSLMNFEGWTGDNAIMKARMIKSNGSADIINLVQCTTEPSIYYFENVVNLADYTKVQMLRTNPADGATWNSSAEHTFTTTNVCVYITGWDNSSNISVYNGSCTVTDSYVLISKKAEVSQDGQSVSLYGYLSSTLCNANITEYGFLYCQGTATQGCTPNRNSPRIRVTENVTHLVRGEEFSIKDYSGLVQGCTYGYKAYVMMNDMMMLSDETGYFTLADCTTRPVKGEAITYTVDASLGVTYENPCTLTYGSLETAIKRLKESYNDENSDYQYVTKKGDSYNLYQDVTMNVRFYDDSPDVTGSAYAYAGTKKVTSAGSDKVDGGTNLALLIDFINLNATYDYTLTIKADNPNAQPWVHHPIIRNSRNITLDGLAMYSDPSGKINDCAFEIDVNTTKWDGIQLGQVADANILIKNCYIGSSGFSGVHVSGYDGVTFYNNDFEATFDKGTANDKEWGASAKFMTTKNVKFINNNFRGDHCTLLWIQECQNMLFMNNVFWNTNKFMDLNYTPSAIRLVTQFGTDLQNIGVFYNTSYFAANTTVSSSKYDFMSFKVGSGSTTGSSADFIVSKIYFLYNNCYSYDSDCPGRSDSPFLGITLPDANFCGNNFWSQYDQDIYDDLSDAEKNTYVSEFAFGCSSSEFINVKGEVCTTTATGPASLVVQGENLNLGTPLKVEDIETATGIEVTDEEVTSDRYNEAIRKEEDRWTLGAYQQQDNIDTKVIIWQGVTSNQWDDRNNWIDAATGQRLSCLHNLAEDLIAIIPSANSEVYPTPSHGVLYWPNIPSSFNAADRAQATITDKLPEGIPASEQVTANANEFAKTIELEYGAGITGVEHLVNGKTHYTNAIMGFEAPRSQWILVGTVIKPYDEELGDYRNIVSGDYFIKTQEPHVYMHEAKLDASGNASWAETFADLDIEVPATKVFAIQIPDEYGKYKLPAAFYNQWNGTNFDPTAPISYKNFDGRFVNDAALPVYEDLTAEANVLLNNSYPANIDARKIETLTDGTVQYYDYNSGTFMNTDATTDAVLLRPQHGFIFKPYTGKTSLEITKDMLAGGDTKSRSAEVTLPTLSLNLYNANTGVGYSNVVVKVDEMLAEGEVAPSNVVKVFSPNVDSPELYIVANDEMYSRYSVANESQMIPLGVRLKKDMNIKFERAYFKNFSEATLIDTDTDKEINLLRNTYTTETLVAGDIEGRFYLNLGVAVEEEEEEGDNTDDNVTTEVEENEEMLNGAINIFVEEADNTIRVVTNDVELRAIYVNDMAGRTMKYDVKGYAANLKLPVAQGVYTINVIGDTASRTEKVILK